MISGPDLAYAIVLSLPVLFILFTLWEDRR
jgi:hypothetical protein